MPQRRRYGGRRRRRRRRPRKRQSITRQLKPGYSDSQVVTLKYADVVTLDPGAAGAAANHVFSANGVFDPDITGTGHQPLAFDQWANFYNHVTVIGSRISVSYVSGSNSVSTGSLICGIDLSAGTTLEVNMNTLRERGRANYRIMTSADSGRAMTTVHKGYSAKKFHGRTDILDNDDLQGTFSSNPAEQAFYHVFAGPTDNATDSTAFSAQVLIEYICIMREPRQLVGS